MQIHCKNNCHQYMSFQNMVRNGSIDCCTQGKLEQPRLKIKHAYLNVSQARTQENHIRPRDNIIARKLINWDHHWQTQVLLPGNNSTTVYIDKTWPWETFDMPTFRNPGSQIQMLISHNQRCIILLRMEKFREEISQLKLGGHKVKGVYMKKDLIQSNFSLCCLCPCVLCFISPGTMDYEWGCIWSKLPRKSLGFAKHFQYCFFFFPIPLYGNLYPMVAN